MGEYTTFKVSFFRNKHASVPKCDIYENKVERLHVCLMMLSLYDRLSCGGCRRQVRCHSRLSNYCWKSQMTSTNYRRTLTRYWSGWCR